MLVAFFFNDPATTEIYTLSLHDALPIFEKWEDVVVAVGIGHVVVRTPGQRLRRRERDRKSTRLNSSHSQISYAVFCLKKKKSLRNADEHSLVNGLRTIFTMSQSIPTDRT